MRRGLHQNGQAWRMLRPSRDAPADTTGRFRGHDSLPLMLPHNDVNVAGKAPTNGERQSREGSTRVLRTLPPGLPQTCPPCSKQNAADSVANVAASGVA